MVVAAALELPGCPGEISYIAPWKAPFLTVTSCNDASLSAEGTAWGGEAPSSHGDACSNSLDNGNEKVKVTTSTFASFLVRILPWMLPTFLLMFAGAL